MEQTILQKIGLIQQEIKPIGKATDGFNYKYANEIDLAKHLKPFLKKYNLAIIPKFISTPTLFADDSKFYFTVSIDIIDTSNKNMESFQAVFGNNLGARDNLAQKLGGAMTYGMRYFLIKTFYIPAFDKDDPDYAEGEKARKKANIKSLHPTLKNRNIEWPDAIVTNRKIDPEQESVINEVKGALINKVTKELRKEATPKNRSTLKEAVKSDEFEW